MANRILTTALVALVPTLCATPGWGKTVHNGKGSAVVKILHKFDFDDGCLPSGGLIADGSGNLYGTANCGPANKGVVFEVGGKGKYKVLSDFSDPDAGSQPLGRLLLGLNGEIYGVTARDSAGGGAGTVYKLTRKGQMTVLHTFTGGADGGAPLEGLSIDAQGNVYGTGSKGGDGSNDGIIYKITPDGTYSVLHTFSGTDGSHPSGELLSDGSGNFYSVTQQGGSGGSGVVYKMASGGSVTTVHAFVQSEGYFPSGALIVDGSGNFYGTTQGGGSDNVGTVYKIAPNGTLTSLYQFGYFPYCYSHNPCGNPNGGVILKNGALYGVTDQITYDKPVDGTLFRIDADGKFEVVFAFSRKKKQGYLPNGPLLLGADGAFYGTNLEGGGDGTIFKVTNYEGP
jgi:uncharacterized repeat protein (TIGR03803 family)